MEYIRAQLRNLIRRLNRNIKLSPVYDLNLDEQLIEATKYAVTKFVVLGNIYGDAVSLDELMGDHYLWYFLYYLEYGDPIPYEIEGVDDTMSSFINQLDDLYEKRLQECTDLWMLVLENKQVSIHLLGRIYDITKLPRKELYECILDSDLRDFTQDIDQNLNQFINNLIEALDITYRDFL